MLKRSPLDTRPQALATAFEFLTKNAATVNGVNGGKFVKAYEDKLRDRFDRDVREACRLFGNDLAVWEIFSRWHARWVQLIGIVRDGVRLIDSGLPFDRMEVLGAMAELEGALTGFEHTLVENQPKPEA